MVSISLTGHMETKIDGNLGMMVVNAKVITVKEVVMDSRIVVNVDNNLSNFRKK